MQTPTDHKSTQTFGSAEPGRTGTGLSTKWAAVLEAGKTVSMLAGYEPDATSFEVKNFPSAMRNAESWRLGAARNGLDDLSAVMESGMSALLAVHARGNDVSVPATALLGEFRSAQAALLSLAPPAGSMGPRRSA